MNNKIKIAAIIVVYNKNICDSITYGNLQKFQNKEVEIVVVDNSDSKTENYAYCNENGIHYINMHGNKGLSKAYNAAIDECIDKDVLVLLDDDTEITKEYFDTLDIALLKYPEVDIYAPIVYGQDGVIYSPNEFNFLRNHYIISPDQEVAQDKFNAIASCLAIRGHVFEHYRFNEVLFVDQVDQNFFCEQRCINARFMKLNVTIHQNFYQRAETLTPEAGWRRLKLRIVDVMRHARLLGGLRYVLLGYMKCCGLGIQIGKKSKSPCVITKAIALSTKLLFLSQ